MHDLEHIRLFVATPAYGGLVTTHYLQSLLRDKAALERRGATVAVYTIANESLISRARNACVARFLAARTGGESFTHLLFIDADVGFPPGAIERLLAFDAPLTAGCYPLKGLDWEALAQRLAGGLSGATAEDLAALAARFPIQLELPAAMRDDFISALAVGTGFMCIRHDALGALSAEADAVTYRNDVPGYELPGDGYDLAGPLVFRALFEPGVDPVTHTYHSEDYTFCARWRRTGGEVWVDVRTPLVHVGAYPFHGLVADFLRAHGVGLAPA